MVKKAFHLPLAELLLTDFTPAQIQNVHSAFPHISHEAIAYSLSKTRSVQATSESILEQGFLPEVRSSCSYKLRLGLKYSSAL